MVSPEDTSDRPSGTVTYIAPGEDALFGGIWQTSASVAHASVAAAAVDDDNTSLSAQLTPRIPTHDQDKRSQVPQLPSDSC